jgi:septal ring factor EnvC (AmiA/AmiB activator)
MEGEMADYSKKVAADPASLCQQIRSNEKEIEQLKSNENNFKKLIQQLELNSSNHEEENNKLKAMNQHLSSENIAIRKYLILPTSNLFQELPE